MAIAPTQFRSFLERRINGFISTIENTPLSMGGQARDRRNQAREATLFRRDSMSKAREIVRSKPIRGIMISVQKYRRLFIAIPAVLISVAAGVANGQAPRIEKPPLADEVFKNIQ